MKSFWLIRKLPVAALRFALLACLFPAPSQAQKDLSGETKMRLMLEELNNLGSVMTIA